MQKRKAAGKEVPALDSKPELDDEMQVVWRIWRQLHQCRQVGMGLCPLAVPDIVAALELYGVYDKTTYFEWIVAVDQAWLTWASEENERKRRKV